MGKKWMRGRCDRSADGASAHHENCCSFAATLEFCQSPDTVLEVCVWKTCGDSRYWMSSVIAIYPGSFDPITLGHLDIIERGTRLFDHVVVAIARNPNKIPLFTVEQRVAQIQQAAAHLSNVEVDSFEGLTVTYARSRRASVLIRGLRAISDFEMELQMAHTNKTLSDNLETVFLVTSNEYSFLSSSVVREIAKFGGPVDHLVPHHVAHDLYQCYVKNHPVPNQTEITMVPTAIVNPVSISSGN
jgi:pantetheine-phosphate adenylyltransferase